MNGLTSSHYGPLLERDSFPNDFVKSIQIPYSFWPSRAEKLYRTNPNDYTNLTLAIQISTNGERWKFELMQAKALYLNGDFQNCLKLTSKLKSTSLQALMLETCTLIQLKMYLRAHSLAIEILNTRKQDDFSIQIIQALQRELKPDTPLSTSEIRLAVKYNPLFIRQLKNKAHEGDSNAQCNLGNCFKHGIGMEKDPEMAVQLFHQSAVQGNSYGQYKLADYYQKGTVVKKDLEKNLDLLRKSADQNNPAAQFKLGDCYLNGIGVEVDKKKANELFQKSADQGNASGEWELGYCYFYGDGVERNLELAIQLFQKSAEQEAGDGNGFYALGYCYLFGIGVNKDLNKAFQFFQKSADFGNASGQYYLSDCYMKGKGVKKDLKKGIELLHQSADRGHVYGQFELGVCYVNGLGVTADREKGKKYIQKSADQGLKVAKKALDQLNNSIFFDCIWDGGYCY